MMSVLVLVQEEADMATQQDAGQAEATAGKLATLRDDVRAAIGRVDDPQLKAVLENGAEVLGGLRRAFIDYGKGSEEAWQRPQGVGRGAADRHP
jgi:hypothetical protein